MFYCRSIFWIFFIIHISCIDVHSEDSSQLIHSRMCQSTLNAMRAGSASSVVESELQGRTVSPDNKDKFIHTAQEGLDRMMRAGGGLPEKQLTSLDVVLKHGDYARINTWVFPNGITGYAGCVRYETSENIPTSIVRMNSNLESLKEELDYYVSRREPANSK